MTARSGGQGYCMWLAILIVVLIIFGIAGSVAGMGIFGFIPLVLGLIGLAALFIGRGSGEPTAGVGEKERTPQDTVNAPQAHVETGHAHSGQEHMTP